MPSVQRLLPKEAGETQRSEMRMSFMSGMYCFTQMMLITDQSSDEINTLIGRTLAKSMEYTLGGTMLDVYNQNKEIVTDGEAVVII